ncbi:uncharacterized protein [Argopecten irradians]|uniref:uncharacterized protein n=1 Tax=Argopecten irradians TaxID=31199 RepID=UPI0037202D94
MSFPVPCLLPLDFIVDRWNLGDGMALCFHSLLNDIIEEPHGSRERSYLHSNETKSQRKENIDFCQMLSSESITKPFNRIIKERQHHKNGELLQYNQWTKAQFVNPMPQHNGKYIANVLTSEATRTNVKRRVPKEQYADLKVKVIFLGENGAGKTTVFETFERVMSESKTVKQTHSRHISKTVKDGFPRKAHYESVIKRAKGRVTMTVCDTAGKATLHGYK